MTIDQTPEGQNPYSSSAQDLFKIDQQQARRQLDYLGYKSGDNVYLRFFYHSDDPRKNEGSGKYVVISLSSLQARIVMMNKIPNGTNMIF